ncbi:hypothetical protein [Planktothrix sp.]|uniref:hypothetical protein n=1 Tax=Planktothrix sp. TaxID=3088171 RepID=UPI0038D3F3C8
MSKQEEIEKKAFQALQRLRKVTKMGAAEKDWNLNEFPNFDVYDYSPNQRLDGDNRYKLAGREWSIILQTSILQAIHDILGNRLGYTIDFEEWFKDFEYEFIKALPIGKQPPEAKLKPWGKEVKNRPKKLNLLDKKEAAKKGYMIIRFWPDREAEDTSILLAGTYSELRQQMLAIMRPSGGSGGQGSLMSGSSVIRRKGQPQVILWFVEDREDVEEGYDPVWGRISFRLMDCSDGVSGDQPAISKADVERLATQIHTLFCAPNRAIWRKGKEMYVYADYKKGYDFRVLCRNVSDGREVVQKVLQIQNHTFEAKRGRQSVPDDPMAAYPTVPPTFTLFGEQRKQDRLRPIADVKFSYAELLLGSINIPIILVNPEGKILPNGVNATANT